MGALVGLGVSLLGTAAGRTAATLAMGGQKKGAQLSQLDKIAQNNLIQVPTFGNQATQKADLDPSLLGSIIGIGDPTNPLSNNNVLSFEIAPGLTTDNPDNPNLPGNREAARKVEALKLEREQIASRQANFRKQIRGGSIGRITSLSPKTLLGKQL